MLKIFSIVLSLLSANLLATPTPTPAPQAAPQATTLIPTKKLNIYAWAGEISETLVKKFEQQTGITVNFSTYQSNEVMFAKLRTASVMSYDLVMPSSYFVDRMRKQGMLEEIDKKLVPNLKNISAEFLHPVYDQELKYSVPFLWGVTGIFVNKKLVDPKSVRRWQDLWAPRFADQLLLLDDTREIFSAGLIAHGFSANDSDTAQIEQTFWSLKALRKNVKVFSTETVISIMIDEDARAGMCWNGDAYKASRENKNIEFIYPEDGFVIWVDNFAIPKGAPHKAEAHAFINFMLEAEAGRDTAMQMNYPVTNAAAIHLLPEEMRKSQTFFPPAAILRRGQFQRDLDEKTLTLYEKFWEEIKLGG